MAKKKEPEVAPEEAPAPVHVPETRVTDADVKGIEALSDFRIAIDSAIADLKDRMGKQEYMEVKIRSEKAVEYALQHAQEARMWAGVALKPFPTGFKETDKKGLPETRSKPV